MSTYARNVILFGRDADSIETDLNEAVPVIKADSLDNAVIAAKNISKAGDTVLMSPACASFDMFDNYEQRGRIFMETVRQEVLC